MINLNPYFYRIQLKSIIYIILLFLSFILCSCGTNTYKAQNGVDTFTGSDEPEQRRRASNRLKLAVLYFNDAKYNFALDEVKQAIAIDADWFEAYNMRGLIYMRMGELALADGSFQKSLNINPESAEVKHNYGVLLCKLNRPEEAYKMFTAAIATKNYIQSSNSWMEFGVCQSINDKKLQAEASFLKSYELNPSNYASAYALGTLLFQRGDAKRAQVFVRRINNSEFASAESLWLGMRIERFLGNTEVLLQLGGQLKKRFPLSRENLAFERGAFDE